MSPPELTADAPVLNVFEPLTINALPLLGEDVDFARGDGLKAHFTDGFAGVTRAFGSRFAHRHVPLLGQHRFNDFARARDARHHVLDVLDADQQALRVQVRHAGLAASVTIHAAVLFGHVVVHGGGLREDVHHGEVVALADFKVVEVVGGRDLYAAGSEFAIHVFVSDDGNFTVGQGEFQHLADQVLVAFVVRMHGDSLVTEKRFRTRRRNDDAFAAVGGRVTDFPEMSGGFFAFDFEVAHRALQLRIPVDEALAAVNEAFAIKLNEGLFHDLGQLFVHREIKTGPVKAVPQAAHLIQNRTARNLLPVPNALDEFITADVAAILAFALQLAFHHDLRGDAGVIGTRKPQRVVARHAVVTGQGVHHGLVEGVPHVENPGNVGRGQLNGKAGFGGIAAGLEVAAVFPNRIPARFNVGRFKALGELLRSGLTHVMCFLSVMN